VTASSWIHDYMEKITAKNKMVPQRAGDSCAAEHKLKRLQASA
jgi:hypothetical protein